MQKDINYNETFRLGNLTEKHFASEYLPTAENADPSKVVITGGNFPEFDIEYGKTWEIKTSAEVTKYKHHFVEYYQTGKPSGMQKTTADDWVFYGNDGLIYSIDRKELDALCMEKFKRTNKWSYTNYVTKSGKVSGKGIAIHKDNFTVIGEHDLEIKQSE